MSSITRNALSTAWKTCGVTRRAWNGNQRNRRIELRMEETRFRASRTRSSVFLRTVAAAVSAAHFCNSCSAGKMPAGLTGPNRTGVRWLCYGDLFGEVDADAAAGDVVAA